MAMWEHLEKVDTTHTVSIVDDDLVNFSVLNGTGTSAITWNKLTAEFETTGSPAKHIQMGFSQLLGAQARAITRYYAFAGYTDANSTEADAQIDWPIDGFAAKNLSCNITQNSITPESSTFVLRKNGANSALSVSIPASTTGFIEDITNSVTLVDGDDVNFALVSGTGSGFSNDNH